MKQYKKKIEKLQVLCKDYLNCVNDYGNECAYTDRKLETILEFATIIKEQYNKDSKEV